MKGGVLRSWSPCRRFLALGFGRKLLVRLLRFLPMLVRQVQLVVDMVEVFEQLIGAVANDVALSITIKVPD